MPWGLWAMTFGVAAFLLAFSILIGRPEGGPVARVLILLLANPFAWFAYVWLFFGLWLGKVHTVTLDRTTNLFRLHKQGLFGSQQQVEHPLSSVRRAFVAERRRKGRTYAVELELEDGKTLMLSQALTQGRAPKQEVADVIEGFLRPASTQPPGARPQLSPEGAGWGPGGFPWRMALKGGLAAVFMVYVLAAAWWDTHGSRESLRTAQQAPGATPASPRPSTPVLAEAPVRPDTLQVSEVGSTLSSRVPALAVTREGIPYVAYVKAVGSGDARIAVVRWSGSEWLPLGMPLSVRESSSGANNPALVLPAEGQPVVAWAETDEKTDTAIHVRQWNGGLWLPMGQALPVPASSALSVIPALASDARGNLWLAWTVRSQNLSSTLYLYRWNAGRWEPASSPDGKLPESISSMTGPSLAVSAEGEVGVASNTASPSDSRMIIVWRYGAQGWQRLGGEFEAVPGRAGAQAPVLTVDSQGQPVAAWSEWDGAADNVYVQRWDGAQWKPLGGAIHGAGGSSSARLSGLGVAPGGQLIVGFQEPTPRGERLFRARWDQDTWRFMGPAVSATPSSRSLKGARFMLDAQGTSWFVWTEAVEDGVRVFVHSAPQ